MPQPAILFMDDDEEQLPDQSRIASLQGNFGIQSVVADAVDPITSGLQLVRDRPNIVAVETDRCGQKDYSHIAELRRLQPHLLIALVSGHLTPDAIIRAQKAGADFCYSRDESRREFYQLVADNFQCAVIRFRSELPALLADTSKIGRWVGFTRNGIVAEADDDISVIRQCRRSYEPDDFIVARVLPNPEPLEMTGSWSFSNG